jgi:SPASM domain peptide maturase of grasp-with-spasm system
MNKTKIKCIKIHSCINIVKGHCESVIIDTQRNLMWKIDTEYAGFLLAIDKKEFSEIYKKVSTENRAKYEDLIQNAFENELIFLTNIPDNYPSISDYWNEPFNIANLIWDFKNDSFKNKNIFEILKSSYIKSAQFRFFISIEANDFELLLATLKQTHVKTSEYILPYSETFTQDFLQKIVNKYDSIAIIAFYNAPLSNTKFLKEKGMGIVQYYTDASVMNEKSCGIVSANYFTLNIKHFTESQHHNTCLNRKISIDTEGNIKNCPSMAQSFGNIRDTTLQEALDHPDFKKYWNIKKDDILVCKDCEFRHICTDCRAYIENPEDMYSKPLKCGYNPYTAEWEEWSTNPLKQKAIAYYGMKDLVKKEMTNA